MPDAVRLPARTQSAAHLQRLIDTLADDSASIEARQGATSRLLDSWLGTQYQCATQAHRLLKHISALSGAACDPMRQALMAVLRPAMQRHSPQVDAAESLARHARHEHPLRDLAQSKVTAFARGHQLTDRQRVELKHRVDQRLREALLGDLATLTYAELGSEGCLTAARRVRAYAVFDQLPELIVRLRRYEVSERYAPVPEVPVGMRVGAIEDFLQAVCREVAHAVQDANEPTRIKFFAYVARVFSYAEMEGLTDFYNSPEGQDYRELRDDVAGEIWRRGEEVIDAALAARPAEDAASHPGG